MMALGLLFPRVYLFLISSSGYALLFTYVVILAIHIRFCKIHGCPSEGQCQMPGFPYTSWFALIGMIVVILSMPFISGQGSGLVEGIVMLALYSSIYMVMKRSRNSRNTNAADRSMNVKRYSGRLETELAEELINEPDEKDK